MEIGDIKPGSIKSISFKVIESGDSYKISLTTDSLHYYKNDELITVRDVNPEFNSQNLYETVIKIAAKYNVPKENFIIGK